ncbi:adenosylmethionine--8-amino-7-oxononanoate transaminase [Blastopirellula marina]|uniref:Adenosylmethionine-8-amino-7-oxononanoate aminotransferase n=1 Tax=Blastopirellula marina TaxID=124 RepID=A0A2S8F7U9_9BACT|nr:adenosylmethionine--8-amino-7-oxononanoate transaminase [Blastopirellula marina]PQO28228.1 adenosylmethionine--8-amino-7-oxononanoate transaminase [Blastopirellula marina]PTL41768.1 adenosylmethionine--8-amino-7-oxononanoate transaminase [Blastopirellula marina]
MNPTAQQLTEWDKRYVWHAFTQMACYEPLIIESAEGCELIDIEGRRLLDGVSSMWCNVHGHCHPAIDAAIKDQLGKVAHVTNLGCSNSTAIRLAKRLSELTPGDLDHSFFCSDGASALEVAIKLAFQYWHQCEKPQPKKTTYIGFEDAYHGDTIGTISVGGVDQFNAVFKPLMFPVHRLLIPDRRVPDEASACTYHLQVLEETLQQHHETIAAVVIEPLVLGAAGMIVQPHGYLRGVRELTQKYNVLMIADEVAVGLGRTGKMFACDHEEVVPDILCLGKGLSGGYLPMSAAIATTEIWNAYLGEYGEAKQLCHGHTFGGNPLGSAAALATLDLFEEEQTLAQLPAKMARISEHLTRLKEHSHVGDVRQCGMIAAVEIVRDKATGEHFAWTDRHGHQVCQFALQHGVWIRPLGDVLVIMPPLSVSLPQIDQLCAVIAAGIEHVTHTKGHSR